MSDIKIICDSLSDLTDEDLKKYDIDMVYITIVIDGVEYKERLELSIDEFYKRLREENVYPTTSQVSFSEFKDIFKKYLDQGRQILYICASSAATGTYQSASLAKQYLEDEGYDVSGLKIIDSMQLSYGVGLLLLKACEMRENGASLDEIVEDIEKVKGNYSYIVFSVDTLEYLKKGGRISSTKAALGNMLNIKPILYMNDIGTVSQIGHARGRKNLASKMIGFLKEEIGDTMQGKTLYVGLSDGLEEAKKVEEKVVEEFKPDDVKYIKIGAGIGTHGGPGIFAFFVKR